MNRGYVRLWRKIQDSAVFQNEGLLKVFLWCLIRVTYQETWVTIKTGRGFTEVNLLPGSFIFGRKSAAKELRMPPSTVWKRILKLQNLQILNIESDRHWSIIHIINWPIYQAEQEEGDSRRNRQGTGKEHKQELKELKEYKNPRIFFSEISTLAERYPDQEIITRAFHAISSTRKSDRIADSVKRSILQGWNEYPVESVMAGIKTYLDKDYAGQGKTEKYLLGIIRNAKPETSYSGPSRDSRGGTDYAAYLRGEIKVEPEATAL